MKLYKIQSLDPIAKNVSDSIANRLDRNEKVLWLMGGGSGIKVAVAICKNLQDNKNLKNLVFMLTDERYGNISHKDSNWQQLKLAGFSLEGANLIRVLNGKGLDATTSDYGAALRSRMKAADFKIGLFGMGSDGHTAGILPGSPAIDSRGFVVSYKAPDFKRITMSFTAIENLDEAVLYAAGESKHNMIEKLAREVDISEQPAQILKRVRKFTVYNDYKGESI